MIRRRITKLIGALIFLASSIPAQPALQSGADITVRIFYAHIVREMTLTATSATMRSCETCAARAVAAPLEVHAVNSRIEIKNASSVAALYLDGAVKIDSQDSNSALLHAEAAGRWRIIADAGQLHIQVALPSERYVMAALAAEAAPDEPIESLRALAIVVRTYALENLHRHAAQGFDLCDSTHCQAVRLGSVRHAISEAVTSTAGETLFFAARRAVAYFTQNCGGQTESALAAWGKSEPWLQSHPDPYCSRRSPALWTANIRAEELIETLRRNGWHPPAHLTGAKVVRRTASGRAALVEFTGDRAPLRISAGDLRFALDRSLGWQQIRSNSYDIALQADHVLFMGKGYGHGVGLCQAGAFEMAKSGSNAAAILNFYFPGTVVRITPVDTGWEMTRAEGWSLEMADVSHHDGIIAAGNQAWQRARQLFPPQRQNAPPVVTLSPDTEYFRQSTDSPGWMLAVTIGNHIRLQPYSVLQRNGGDVESLLLHEMLHALIEMEATEKAPLWLREGLAEYLGSPNGFGTTFVLNPSKKSIAALESALANPASSQQSQAAHTNAARLVADSIKRYGFSAVRGWLVSGVPASAGLER
jgi:stage II sporulation protein D